MKHQQIRKPVHLGVVAENAEKVLLRDGEHTPMLIVFGSKSNGISPVEMPETAAMRAIVMRTVGLLLNKSREIGVLQEVYFIHEGWMVSRSANDTKEITKPSDEPDRKEMLLIEYCHMDHGKPSYGLVFLEMLRNGTEELIDLFKDPELNTGEIDVMHSLIDKFVKGF